MGLTGPVWRRKKVQTLSMHISIVSSSQTSSTAHLDYLRLYFNKIIVLAILKLYVAQINHFMSSVTKSKDVCLREDRDWIPLKSRYYITTAWTRNGHGMSTAWARHGHGMGTAWARYGMCELTFNGYGGT